jgi:CheY-like chemotaxis protein
MNKNMKKILFVENDASLAALYKKWFPVDEFECDVVSTGKEALQKLAHDVFDIVLFEVNLPDENAVEILTTFRTDVAYPADLRIVILSTSEDAVLHRKIVEIGVDGFIPKLKFPPMRLMFEVKRFLHQFEEQRKNEERIANGGTVKKNGKRILLVEDEEVFIDMFGTRLRNDGYEVDVAQDGAVGFEKAVNGKYDLIITDVVMPALNGQELIDKLKNDERTSKVPVFVFSASVGSDVMDQFRCDGLRCFMKTHVTPSELAREVGIFLGLS